jgi:hypothetical protein
MDLTPFHSSPGEDERLGEQPSTQRSAPEPEAAGAEIHPAGSSAVQLTIERAARRQGREIGGKKFRVGTGDEYVPFRSRTKRRRRFVVTGVVGVALAGIGVYGTVSLVGPQSQSPRASGCPARGGSAAAAQSVNPHLPAAGQIKLNVYNSTNRQGLAASTASVLKQRGFTITKVTNDPLKANLRSAAQIRGNSVDAPAMRVVAAEVAGAELQPDARTDGTVDLVLGAGFTALATPDQVSAALRTQQMTAARGTPTSNCG